MKLLDRLIFEQGGRCFFCHKQIPKSHASVEHLVSKSAGGTDEAGNVVVCCKTLNGLFGSKSIKDKIKICINQEGGFQCPEIKNEIAK